MLGSREAHFIGDYTAVCWNTETVKKTLKKGGVKYTAHIEERCSPPYIDFINLRDEDGDTFYEDDDSPISGGIDVAKAEKLIEELKKAVVYLKDNE